MNVNDLSDEDDIHLNAQPKPCVEDGFVWW